MTAKTREARQAYEIRSLRVQELPVRQQPREMVQRLGVDKVDDHILLAVLLRTGLPDKNVVDLARELLDLYGGSLTAMSRVSKDDLTHVDGMGPVKAQVLECAFELARRMSKEALPDRPIVREPEEAVKVVRAHLTSDEVETFWVLVLDTRYRLVGPPIDLTKGIIDASLVHPREAFKEAVRRSGAAVVLAHNHPSGDPTPSAEDIRITRRLVEAGKLMEIEALDHVILGHPSSANRDGYVSMRESGLVAF